MGEERRYIREPPPRLSPLLLGIEEDGAGGAHTSSHPNATDTGHNNIELRPNRRHSYSGEYRRSTDIHEVHQGKAEGERYPDTLVRRDEVRIGKSNRRLLRSENQEYGIRSPHDSYPEKRDTSQRSEEDRHARVGELPQDDEENRRYHGQDEWSEQRRSLASLALAVGSGEDVAALSSQTPRWRFAFSPRAASAVIAVLMSLLLITWAWIGLSIWREEQELAERTAKEASIEESEEETIDQGEEHTQGKETLIEPATAAGNTEGLESLKEAPQAFVYVSGAVTKPGVYSLPQSSRLADAIALAGGLVEGAQAAAVNLAAPIEDGMHIHIPREGEVPPQTNSGEEKEKKVNINTATSAQLQELSGIGPSLAQTIIEWREKNGKFTRPEDLTAVPGIGEATYAKMKDSIAVK